MFSRSGDDYAKVEGEIETLQTTMIGDLALVANQFTKWDIESENWESEIPAEEILPFVVSNVHQEEGDPVAVKVHLGLETEDPADPKAKEERC